MILPPHAISHTCIRVSGLSIWIRMNAPTHRRQLKSLVSLTLPHRAFDRQCTARALCCSWTCIINTVRANSTESPIISRGKLYVNAPLMASFVNGIVVQARGIEPCRERNSIRSSMPRAARESSFNNLAVIVSCRIYTSACISTYTTPNHIACTCTYMYVCNARFLEKSRRISLKLML